MKKVGRVSPVPSTLVVLSALPAISRNRAEG